MLNELDYIKTVKGIQKPILIHNAINNKLLVPLHPYYMDVFNLIESR